MTPRPIHPPSDRDRQAWSRLLPPAALAVAIAHAVVLFFVAVPAGDSMAKPEEDVFVIDLVEPIPPPPEERARPAEPILAEDPVDDTITIAPTEIVEMPPPVEGPPVVEPPAGAGDAYGFVPHTVEPRCVEGCSTEAIVARLPALVRRAGVSCDVVIGIRIDPAGAVTKTQVLASSGHAACEAATAAWARSTRWSAAYNRDVPVAVWVAQPVAIRTE